MAESGEKVEISEELIKEYVGITGSDEESARHLLEAFGGDLECAVNMYLEGSAGTVKVPQTTTIPVATKTNNKIKNSRSPVLIDDGPSSSSSSSVSSKPNQTDSVNIPDDDDVRAPIPQQQAILAEDEYHALPYQRPQRQTSRSVFDSFRDFRKETEERERLIEEGRRGTTTSKRKRLHELFRPPVDILHTGNFQSARSHSTAHGKWLLVNVQKTMEFGCQVLNRDVWANDVVRDIIKESFTLWQVYHDSDEGQHYGTFYAVKNYPHLAVIDPRTGERMVVWENLGMKPSANQFAELTSLFLAENPTLNGEESATAVSNEDGNKAGDISEVASSSSLIDRSEDAQLEAAIQASLEMSKQPSLVSATTNDERDNDEEEGDSLMEDDEDNGDSDVEPVVKDFSSSSNKRSSKTKTCLQSDSDKDESPPSTKKQKVGTVKEDSVSESSITQVKTLQCTKTQGESSSTTTTTTTVVSTVTDDNPPVLTGEIVKILLRTPTNKRRQIKMSHDATLEDLAKEVSRLGWSSSRYELIKPYPRQNLSLLDQTTSLKNAGLHKQETIFIQDR